MFEAVLVAVLATLFGLLGWLGPERLMTIGGLLAALGLVGSLPAGLAYHLRLRARLARNGPPPRRWWWAPSRFHPVLGPEGRAAVMPFFTAGVVLISLCGVGLLFVATGTVKAYLAMGR